MTWPYPPFRTEPAFIGDNLLGNSVGYCVQYVGERVRCVESNEGGRCRCGEACEGVTFFYEYDTVVSDIMILLLSRLIAIRQRAA